MPDLRPSMIAIWATVCLAGPAFAELAGSQADRRAGLEPDERCTMAGAAGSRGEAVIDAARRPRYHLSSPANIAQLRRMLRERRGRQEP